MRQYLDPVLRTSRYFGRYEKPRYYSSESPIIVVPGSSSAPIMLVIAGRVYEKTSDMTCNLNRSGEDGMNLVTLAANTPYYLYAILGEDGYPHLIGDIQEPARGPQGYSEWTYIGATTSRSSTATIDQFSSTNGMYIADDEMGDTGTHSTTTVTAYTISNMPVTVSHVYGLLYIKGSAVNVTGRVSGKGSASGVQAIRTTVQVADDTTLSDVYGWVSIFEEKTVYLKVDADTADVRFFMTGWKEDCNAYA